MLSVWPWSSGLSWGSHVDNHRNTLTEMTVGNLALGLIPAYNSSVLEQDQMLETVQNSLHITYITTDMVARYIQM